jgi:hypothetical protein
MEVIIVTQKWMCAVNPGKSCNYWQYYENVFHIGILYRILSFILSQLYVATGLTGSVRYNFCFTWNTIQACIFLSGSLILK